MAFSLPLDTLRQFQIRVRISPEDGRLSFDMHPRSSSSPAPTATTSSGSTMVHFSSFEDYRGRGLCLEAAAAVETSFSPMTVPSAPPSDAGIVTPPDLGMQQNITIAPTIDPTAFDTLFQGFDMPSYMDVMSDEKARDVFDSGMVTPALTDSDLSCTSWPFADPVSAIDQSPVSNAFLNMPAQMEPAPLRNDECSLAFLPSHPESSPSGSDDGQDDERPAGTDSAPSGRKRRNRHLACSYASCNRTFTSEYTRRVHEQAHDPKPRPPLVCTMGCTEAFSRQHDRLRHEVALHGKVCEHICNVCGHFFSSDRMLKIHKCRGEKNRGRWGVTAIQNKIAQ